VPSVFSKNRERLVEHDAIVELFNRIVEQADQQGLLSGEHFSVDGTLNQAWASHKSFARKDGQDGVRAVITATSKVKVAVFGAKAKADRAWIRLGQKSGSYAASDGAWAQASRSDVCADDDSVKLNADAPLGRDPSTGGVRCQRGQKTGLITQNVAGKGDTFRHANRKNKLLERGRLLITLTAC